MDTIHYLQRFCSTAILFAFCVFRSTVPYAQVDKPLPFVQKFTTHKDYAPQEKIFVHADRTSYVAGEIIWFKVYCINGNNRLSQLSKVAYVEVLDKDQQSVLQAKIALTDGTGSGSLIIPSNLRSGNFLVRSYTNWMKNFSAEFYFHQNITILNTLSVDTTITRKLPDVFDVQFFPEGGHLVNELKSKVAFRATDQSGKGIAFFGAIVDENNDTIVRFSSARFGIGNFNFTPKKDTHYKAVLTIKGNVVTTKLPEPKSYGSVLSITHLNNDRLKIDVHTTTNEPSTTIIIFNNQKVQAAHLVKFVNGVAELEVDNSTLAEGISHITVFNQNNQPLCERLVFKRPKQKLYIETGISNKQFATRKKVTISLSAKDDEQQVQSSEMSMAVFLLDSLPLNSHNFYNYLWMSSELKGVVESPEYYFENDSQEVNQAMDNVLLTHGWRRFNWEQVLAGTRPVFKYFPEIEGHIVNGKIVNRWNDQPGKGILGFLSVPGTNFHLYAANSGIDGDIYFNTRNFYGSPLLVGQTRKPEADSYRLDIVSPFSDSFSIVKQPTFNGSQFNSASLLNRSINMQVLNAYVAEKLHVLSAPKTDTLNFYGKPPFKYMLDDYTRFPTMEEVLREYVREVNVRKRRDNFLLTTVTKDYFGNTTIKEPVMLLDGVPQFDNGNKISHYDPLKVEKLEVIQDRYFLGPASFDGIVSFITYKGDLEGFRFDTASTVLDYDALQLKREFYSPVYETTEQAGSRLPDFRSLLSWMPDIKMDSTGKKEVSFFTSDVPGKYAVVLHGISKEGKSGSVVLTFNVKEER